MQEPAARVARDGRCVSCSEWRDRMEPPNGYRGIWYYNQSSGDEYVYKYSGGLGTYCAKHIPMAHYAAKVNKTFFCYGGTVAGEQHLLEMVSWYDHGTDTVPRPTILIDKGTDDAHDNPVIALDRAGTIWVFASAHGTSRPAYIFRSIRPYSTEAFERVIETSFSYPQPWYVAGRGFLFLHTRYIAGHRVLHWMTSKDGLTWSSARPLADMEEGHYQVSWMCGDRIGTAFNVHPSPGGLNYRTNLYYLETDDLGETWRTVKGEIVGTPLVDRENGAMVHDYAGDERLVYLKDLNFSGRYPVVLYVTSAGYEAGPDNGPRRWTTAYWTGHRWDIQSAITSDSNYDTGCLHVEESGLWRIIGPTETGPQPFNPGGEMAVWVSGDRGHTWIRELRITRDSPHNHTYARRPVNAHPDFSAFWADGHGRQSSDSRLYFCDRTGTKVRRLPVDMTGSIARPEPVTES